MEKVSNKTIRDIYKVLGPFDHYAHHKYDDEMDVERTMKQEFEYRRSGAKYRGQLNINTMRPDGVGFKTYPNGALFEGFFEEGQIHGFGRGITSRGEVYQGPFVYDQMHGDGLFQWPDGRLYYGNFQNGKKQGTGTYMWPNGQTYEGQFKNDDCHGDGIIHYPDGKRFEGCWKDGKKNGTGKYVWPNGSQYFVTYMEGKKVGQGTMDSNQVSIDQVKKQY